MKAKMQSSVVERPVSPKQQTECRYESQQLFCGQQEILIEHAGHAYRLRITRQDKLILTK